MQLSEIEREQLYAIVEKYDHHPDVQRMREYIQHGSGMIRAAEMCAPSTTISIRCM